MEFFRVRMDRGANAWWATEDESHELHLIGCVLLDRESQGFGERADDEQFVWAGDRDTGPGGPSPPRRGSRPGEPCAQWFATPWPCEEPDRLPAAASPGRSRSARVARIGPDRSGGVGLRNRSPGLRCAGAQERVGSPAVHGTADRHVEESCRPLTSGAT